MRTNMKIVGLTSSINKVHDNSVAFLENGKITFAEAEERVSRKKHDGRFPILALREGLKYTKNRLSDIDLFVTADPKPRIWRIFFSTFQYLPTVGFYRYLEQIFKRFSYQQAVSELRSSAYKRVTDDNNLPKSFADLGINENNIVTVSHYLAHAATAYYFSPFSECLVVTMDGYGLDSNSKPLSGKIFKGIDNKLIPLEDVPLHGSLGLYYGAVTMALGFKLVDGEGKTMGLAAYGDPKKCRKKMADLLPDFVNNQWIVRDSILDILNISRTEVFKESRIYKSLVSLVEKYSREDVAAALQEVFEDVLSKYFKYLVKKYNYRKVSVAGGIFLNIKANMKLLDEKIIDELFVYPNPGDSGTALGAAVMGQIIKEDNFPQKEILHTGLGRDYSDSEILSALKKFPDIKYRKLDKKLPREVAKRLVNKKVLGWFQGRGEWGPRALGQRSVIADPRFLATKNRINNILKGREWFMPFAPSMMMDKASDYLVNLRKAPFMIIGDNVKENKQKYLRAVMHIDGTVRPHIVNKDVLPLYYQVIAEFEKLTGVGVILNTSFNKHGLPIVYTPEDAINHLLWGAIDELAIGSYLVEKK